jgi:signal transduction histidine kinase/CheY-like chemotaxis protein
MILQTSAVKLSVLNWVSELSLKNEVAAKSVLQKLRRTAHAKPSAVLFFSLLSSLCLMFASFLLVKANEYLLAATLLVAGPLIVVTVSFYLLNRAHELRMHRMLTAMTAAEQARAQAEAGAREKSRLLATMSHEIRTPLNGVIGMLGLLLETEMNPEQQNYANTANSSSRTLLSIIDEILDTAKAESGQNAGKKSVHLVTLVEGVTELLAPRAHGKNIEISAYVAAHVPQQIIGDELRLRQILFNLAGNAIKFTEKGGVAIDVALNDACDLVIRIADSGIGMTTEESERVFEAYVQANASTARRFGGTGLGLAISRTLIVNMGGKLEMTSAVGQGTTFIVTLPGPFERNSILPKQTLAHRHYALAMAATVGSQHLARSLSELGADVTFVANASELKDQLKTDLPLSSIISDSSYSETLIKWAQQDPQKTKAKANVWVMLKAEERRPLQVLLSAPFSGYLLKPLRKSTLLTVLTERDPDTLKQASKTLRSLSKRAKQKQGLRILLAEDNPVNALLARTMLERAGHKVVCVTNGEAVLETLNKATKFDVALLDVEMPKLNGLETAQAIRSRDILARNGQRLPLLALTASARSEDINSCLQAGMDGHLAKPYDQVDLDETIRYLTSRQNAA